MSARAGEAVSVRIEIVEGGYVVDLGGLRVGYEGGVPASLALVVAYVLGLQGSSPAHASPGPSSGNVARVDQEPRTGRGLTSTERSRLRRERLARGVACNGNATANTLHATECNGDATHATAGVACPPEPSRALSDRDLSSGYPSDSPSLSAEVISTDTQNCEKSAHERHTQNGCNDYF